MKVELAALASSAGIGADLVAAGPVTVPAGSLIGRA
jgi:hypothetical protein